MDNPIILPELKSYNHFDDGKIRESRKLTVTITEIIPFDKIDEKTLFDWMEEIEECPWLYSKETDYFIKGDLQICDNQIEKTIYVRTVDNNEGWFSLGWWGGRLDIDGSLNDSLKTL